MHPAPQQRGGLEFARVNPAARRGKRLYSQVSRPAPQRLGIKFREQRRPQIIRLSRSGVACGKALAWFRVGEIQTAATGNEKFPAYGWFGIKQRYARSARRRHFGGAQARRTAADDRDVDAELKQDCPRRATEFAGESAARNFVRPSAKSRRGHSRSGRARHWIGGARSGLGEEGRASRQVPRREVAGAAFGFSFFGFLISFF